MPLVLYNSLTRRKEPFEPIDPGLVRMYVCGPTVYDLAHIGNGRAVVAFDLLYRVLRHIYGAERIRYVRNITDVEDKIIAAARETGEAIDALTRRTTAAFHADMAALGALPPDIEPRATEYIPQMIAMIERLIASRHAYVAEGHVLFSVTSDPDYGQLSRRSRDDMIAGARVEVAPYKRDPMDFVLWKPSPPDLPGWESPWGRGRPGWHIECSAMAWRHLGETFDIHGGGIDLEFPHHENEIAQSRCAFHKPLMANFWTHNGFLQVEGEKMSKSLGNFFTIREVLADWQGDVIRLAMLASHYRQPINWTVKGLEEAEKALANFVDAASAEAEPRPAPGVLEALADDLNTPQAISEMHALRNAAGRKALAGTLAFFGFRPSAFAEWRAARAPAPTLPEEEIDRRIAARLSARKARNFAEADRIRDELAALGVVLKDSKDGTTWEVAR